MLAIRSLSSDQDSGHWSRNQPIGLENGNEKVDPVILSDGVELDSDNFEVASYNACLDLGLLTYDRSDQHLWLKSKQNVIHVTSCNGNRIQSTEGLEISKGVLQVTSKSNGSRVQTKGLTLFSVCCRFHWRVAGVTIHIQRQEIHPLKGLKS